MIRFSGSAYPVSWLFTLSACSTFQEFHALHREYRYSATPACAGVFTKRTQILSLIVLSSRNSPTRPRLRSTSCGKVAFSYAQTLVLARRPGRHHPPAPGQDRRPHRRAEEPHPHRPDDQLSRSGDPPPHPLPPAAPRHLNRRAACPTVTLPPTSSPRSSAPQFGIRGGAKLYNLRLIIRFSTQVMYYSRA